MVTLFVLAFLYTKDHVLLIRRCNAKFGNGLYSLVGGKVEPHETALHAIKREVNEEVGLKLPESAFTLVHTFHRKGTETEFIALCFKADITEMQLQNMEPHKHDDLRFFTIKTFRPIFSQVINKQSNLFKITFLIQNMDGNSNVPLFNVPFLIS